MRMACIVWVVLLQLSITMAKGGKTGCGTNAHIVIAIDSTKRTTTSIFEDQKEIVKGVLNLVKIKYALVVYTGDNAWTYKDFGVDHSINVASLSRLNWSHSDHYGFDPKALFAVKYNRAPDCFWLLRNSQKESYSNLGEFMVKPMGYDVQIPKIVLTFGEGYYELLHNITEFKDLQFNDYDIKKSKEKYHLEKLKDSICKHCKELSLSTPSTPATMVTPEINKTQEMTHSIQISSIVSTTTTSPTNTRVVYPKGELEKDYRDFLEFNISKINLNDQKEINGVINSLTHLYVKSHLLEGDTEPANKSIGFHVLDVLESFCVSVGTAMSSNQTLQMHTNNMFIGISTVNITSFQELTFGRLSETSGFLHLPPVIFKEQKGHGVLVTMIIDPIQPFRQGKILDRNINASLAGKIINVITRPPPTKGPLDPPVTIGILHSKKIDFRNDAKASCVFWDIQRRGWSNAGCTVTASNATVTICQCNHMTHYAVLLSLDDQVTPKIHYEAMTIITYIGCSLSISGVFLTLITFLCLPVLKSERTRIHCNLCIAIGLSQILFLAAGSKELVQNTVACKLYAAFMFYCFMAVFTWMLVEGIHLYQMVIIAFVNRSMMRFYYALGWGLPVVIITIASAITHEGLGTSQFCWISIHGGAIYAFAAPASIIIMINMVVLVSVLRLRVKLDKSSDIHKTVKIGARVSVVLLPLLGMTWLFGFFSVLPDVGVVFKYLFAITNSLQGFMVFVFHCVGNSEVRKEFNRKAEHWHLNRNISTNMITMVSNRVTPSESDVTETINKQ